MQEKNASTGKFTTLHGEGLRASMNAVEGLSVVATVNADGSPNAAVFVPMMPDENHAVLVLAANRTRENIERTGECVIVYDAMDASAPEKAGRHKGARLRLALLREGDAEYGEVAESWPRMNPYTLVFRIVEHMPIG